MNADKAKYFIIKADDLKYNHISKNWIKFIDILNKHEIPAALGLIGGYLEYSKDVKYKRWFLNLISNHEIFTHGYTHELNEYSSSSMKEQVKSIEKTIKMVKEILGISICTFGAPGNNISKETKKALEETPVKIWLFGMDWKGFNLNQRNFEFEYSQFHKSCFRNKYLRYFEMKASLFLNRRIPGNCSFDELVQRYKNVFNVSLIMGQIHPSCWSSRDIEELERFLYFVLEKGKHQFITPKEFVKKQNR